MMIDLNNIVKVGKAIIVGSFPLNIRYSKDIDIICYSKDILIDYSKKDDFIASGNYNGKRIEFLLADKDSSLQKILEDYEKDIIDLLDILYILKAGHIHIAGRNQSNWEKHRQDLEILSTLNCAFIKKDLSDYIKLHRKSTNDRIKQKTPKLKGISKDKFFDDKVKKYMIHDDIHAIMAHKEKPMYSYMQKDDTVECHKDLWDKFSYEDQIKCVLEEAYVIAIERELLPTIMGDKIGKNIFEAFKWALYRICTTLCSGWFRTFASENYFTILNSYDSNYFEKFKIKYKNYEINKSTN